MKEPNQLQLATYSFQSVFLMKMKGSVFAETSKNIIKTSIKKKFGNANEKFNFLVNYFLFEGCNQLKPVVRLEFSVIPYNNSSTESDIFLGISRKKGQSYRKILSIDTKYVLYLLQMLKCIENC